MSPTRRQFLLAGAGSVTALAGCSAFSDPNQSVLLSVHNYSEIDHQGRVLVETDDRTLVEQYLEVAGVDSSDGWTTVETKVTLGGVSSGTPLDVTASFGDGLQKTEQHTLDCSDEKYEGDAILVQFPAGKPVNVDLNLVCYDQFPSSEASQGGINRS